MAQMNRNVNLEEIDSDALFGIDALKNQSFLQKIVFFGSVIIGVMLNVCLPIFFGTSTVVCVFIFMAFLLIGVAFGCNYTEDMTYGKYLYCFFFKPKKYLLYASTEDEEWIKKKAEEIKRAEEVKLQKQRQANPEEQRKLLMKLIIFVVAIVVIIGGVFIYAGSKDEDRMQHHKVEVQKGE
jgi:hypothetical protein